MKRGSLCGVLAALVLGTSAHAADGYFNSDASMIEVGAGVASSTHSDGPIEALIQVEAQGVHQTGFDTGFVLAHIKTEMTGGAGGVPYVDVEFEGLGYQIGLAKDFARVTFANVDFNRNVAINNAGTFRLSLVGVRGHMEENIDPNIKFILGGALDLLGISYTQRVTDGSDMLGSGWGAQAEVGLDFYERFRVTLGGEVGATLGKPEDVYSGTQCDTYTDSWGSHTSCHDTYDTKWNDVRLNSTAYLSLVGKLTENLSVFGRASFNVYHVHDSTGETARSTNTNFQFVLGASYQF